MTDVPPAPPAGTAHTHLRRRTTALLAAAQVLSGVAAGSLISVGSLIAVDLSGSDAWAGSVSTAATLGTAVSALWLARLALQRGRRVSLTTGLVLAATGAGTVIAATVAGVFVLLLVGAALLGVGGAVNLQARFAATDLSTPRTAGRDLSLVVWTGTLGAVTGPNLVRLGDPLARLTGLPELAALFVVPAAGLLAAALVLAVGLRPDPLLTARALAAPALAAPTLTEPTGAPPVDAPAPVVHVPLRTAFATLRRYPQAVAALVGIVVAHAVMIAVMSMTPVHMAGHGASIEVVGLTVSLHLAAMFALSPLVGILADRAGAVPTLVGGLGVLVVAAVVSGSAGGDPVGVTVGLVLLGLGWSCATVAGSAVMARTIPGDRRVTVQGASDALMSLAGAGGGLAAGVALEHVGYGGLNASAGALAVAGAVAVVVIARRARVTTGGASR